MTDNDDFAGAIGTSYRTSTAWLSPGTKPPPGAPNVVLVVFTGFLDHTDEHIGRLVDYLMTRSLMENTLFVLLSDNGATEEGGDFGDVNIRRHYQFLPERFDDQLASIDLLGSEFAYGNYPRGCGHAGNTPLRRFKMHTHGGGIRDPLIIHGPARIREGGLVSPQFCHCSDIVSTVLEAIGLEAPATVQGVEQMPVHGTSLAYTFDDPFAATRKRVQYFELMGNRGLWAGGWKAVTQHVKGTDFDHDRWELYHVDADFSESEDLTERYPEKLAKLVSLWWKEAGRHHVLPLDDRDRERVRLTYLPERRSRYEFEQRAGRVSAVAAPPVSDCSYRIVADVELDEHTEGVILAEGGRFGGYVLFVQNRRLVHEYVGPDRRWIVESTGPLPADRHELASNSAGATIVRAPASWSATGRRSAASRCMACGRWCPTWAACTAATTTPARSTSATPALSPSAGRFTA